MQITKNERIARNIPILLSLFGSWLVFTLLTGGCATLQGQKATPKDLAETVDAFNTAFRWGDYKTAGQFLLPENEDAFWEDAETLQRTTRIAKIEIRSVRLDGISGTSHVVCTYYRLDDPRFQTKVLHQGWKYDERLKRWLLIDPEIYKLLP